MVAVGDVSFGHENRRQLFPLSTFFRSFSTPGSVNGNGSRPVARRMSLARRMVTGSLRSFAACWSAWSWPKRMLR